MKRWFFFLVVGVQVACAGLLHGAEIGVVNMERLIQLHPRTAEDRAILERYIRDFDDERDARLQDLRAKSEELEKLLQEAEDIGLTAAAAEERRRLAQVKRDELRKGEVALREVAMKRQQDLTNQEMRMRERVIRDIQRVLVLLAEEKSLDLILDGGADAAGGYGAVVFSRASFELTDTVLLKLQESVAAPSVEATEEP